MDILSKVTAPVLLIVGGNDFGVIELNEAAFEQIQAKKELTIVPGATHLFEEPGKLAEVAKTCRRLVCKTHPCVIFLELTIFLFHRFHVDFWGTVIP